MSSKQHTVKSKGTDAEEMRRRRDNKLVQLRKNKREEGIEKKRKGIIEGSDGVVAAEAQVGPEGGFPAVPVPKIENLAAYCNGAFNIFCT